MSDQQGAGDKTEQPTANRLKKAREQGQVARSKDFASAILLVVSAAILDASSDHLAQHMLSIASNNFALSGADLRQPGMMLQHLGLAVVLLLQMLIPVLAGIYLLTAVAAAMPEGPLLNLGNAGFKLSRISLIAGFGRLFSVNSLAELGKSILKVTLVVTTMLVYLNQVWETLPLLARQPLPLALERGAQTLISGLYWLGGAVAIVGAIDLPYQAWSHRRKLKMSKQEVKDEHKQQDGKPEVKARIRQLQQKMARGRAEVALPKADVLLINPSHYAVALKYEPDKADAPYVLAKGVDEVALYMRSLAPKYDLEVVSLPPLTRAIYYSTQIEQQIPAPLYQAIAHVLSYVLQLKAFRKGAQAKPAPLPHFHIPDHLRHD
ncbi:EscU/YscU/HrcU family type III secretion system export apparatus switch protein [Ferrimonas kyonanensis]|uniref:EscU/YscU/HrcU family type III secretion system export apparatus switch protein n=1 Tax=Ferrimonas kyonanensis TaxID=364763 RepID=UPI0003FC5B83|nr:flagellar type III secretion system protein FlhB [Ferrimonas kyonanensis]